MKRKLHASVWQEGKWFVAQCLEIDVASQGETEEDSLLNLAEALKLHWQMPLANTTPRLHQLEVELSAA